jgi:hypothetical protein
MMRGIRILPLQPLQLFLDVLIRSHPVNKSKKLAAPLTQNELRIPLHLIIYVGK